jgi:H+/gluconate symporter-like permease
MIPPDQEIYEVERRIAERRHRVEAIVRQSARAALQTLTSPWTLAGAAVIGFLVAGGVQRKHEHRAVSRQTKQGAKAGGIASLAMAAATWIIKSQFGSPAAMAQFFLSKVKRQPAQPVRASPRGDRAAATTRR